MRVILFLTLASALTSCAATPAPPPSVPVQYPALLVLDLQEDFVGASPKMAVAPSQVPGLLERCERLVQGFRAAGRPVIYIRNEFPSSDFVANWFRHGAAVAGTPGVAWVGPAGPPDLWVVKSAPNAFTNPDLGRFLKGQRVDSVVITGVFADPWNCVPSTSAGARALGLPVTVATDAVGTSQEGGWAGALSALSQDGAVLASTAEILSRLPPR